MLNCFVMEKPKHSIPIFLIPQKEFADWQSSQTDLIKNWLNATQFRVEVGVHRIVPNAKGEIDCVVCCVADQTQLWNVGHLSVALPQGIYHFEVKESSYADYAIAFGLGAYQFTRYRKPTNTPAQLFLPSAIAPSVTNIVESIYLVRDLINTPTDDMGPSQLSAATAQLAKQYHAKFTEIVGEDLLAENYASIYTVGRASDDAPRLLDLRWGNPSHPKITLVGKGVCFDTGGLDLKSSAHMLLMKKDMAGSAHVLGLARMIMQANLPISLRVLIPAVENAVSGNAYRPGDIIKSRQGLTIEIGNTDAEGRVVLADALCEAVNDKPDLLIDISTLTGAARVALGTDLPAVFSNENKIVNELIATGDNINDPMWRMPLFQAYREQLATPIADINNSSTEPYAGAITAALFLKEFVPDEIPWLHFDLMAWNLRTKPGRPQGGEAMALRALYDYLARRFLKG